MKQVGMAMLVVLLSSWVWGGEKGKAPYVCTGIGESKDDPRLTSFPLKVVFATNSGALYTDVNVRIEAEGGAPVLETFCDGAWLLVQLPFAKYRITATDQRKTSRSCSVVVSGRQTTCTLKWPD